MEPEEIAAADTASAGVASLQSEVGEEGLRLEGLLSDGTDLEENVVEKMALRGAIEQLNQREKQVILLRFYRGFTQERTARVLGVSQVQISRMEKKAVGRLRSLLI